jgi:predicted ATP-grasp superfamily ATP-dependent carboligase
MKKTKLWEMFEISDDNNKYKFVVKFDFEGQKVEVLDRSSGCLSNDYSEGNLSPLFLNGEKMILLTLIKKFIDEYFYHIPKYTDSITEVLIPKEKAKINTGFKRVYNNRCCILCGKDFTPTGPRQLICHKCKEI